MLQIKFKTEAYHGMGETNGILNIENDTIVMEYQTKDAIIGFIKSSVNRIALTAEKLADVELRKRLFSLVLRFKSLSMTVFDGIPFATGALLEIKLEKKNYDELFIAVQRIKAKIQDIEIRKMENA